MMNKSARLFLAIMVLVNLILMGCSSSKDLEPITVKLGWHHNIEFLGLYVAQNKGYYVEEGLDVTIEPIFDSQESDEVPGKVAAGEYDYGVGGLWLLDNQDSLITIVAALYQFSPGAFFSRVELGINTPADLAGHTVVVKSDSWRILLLAILEQGDLTLDDIEEVPGGFDMSPFYEGEVDVWAGWIINEVVLARQQGLDINTMPIYEYGLRESDNMIYTSRKKIENDPDQVIRFLRATIRGWQWAVDNPVEAVDIMLEMFPDMADDREFHIASFEASIPLIVSGGVQLGTLDCQSPQFVDRELPEGFCISDFLDEARESE